MVGKRNMTVDEILATGRYTDRRGRAWDYFDTRVDYDRWQRWESRGDEDLILEPDEMRLLIERDQHVCQGLWRCFDHPVPHVLSAEWDRDRFGGFMVYPAGDSLAIDEEYDTLPEAMSAARALAVGE